MARGTSFEELVNQLRAECRFSTAASRGTDHAAYLEQVIQRTYELLWDEYDWPFLRVRKENAGKLLAAGQRYYDFPVGMAIETLEEVWFKDGNHWFELEQGIGPEHYSVYDSDADVRAENPLRWDIVDGAQFEVWPVPSRAGEIRFTGKRKCTQLVATTDKAELDDRLIVLFAAAEVLSATSQRDSQAKIELAQKRLRVLRARTAGKTPINFASGAMRRTPLRIRVVSGG
jgi:hypothetical protein